MWNLAWLSLSHDIRNSTLLVLIKTLHYVCIFIVLRTCLSVYLLTCRRVLCQCGLQLPLTQPDTSHAEYALSLAMRPHITTVQRAPIHGLHLRTLSATTPLHEHVYSGCKLLFPCVEDDASILVAAAVITEDSAIVEPAVQSARKVCMFHKSDPITWSSDC